MYTCDNYLKYWFQFFNEIKHFIIGAFSETQPTNTIRRKGKRGKKAEKKKKQRRKWKDDVAKGRKVRKPQESCPLPPSGYTPEINTNLNQMVVLEMECFVRTLMHVKKGHATTTRYTYKTILSLHLIYSEHLQLGSMIHVGVSDNGGLKGTSRITLSHPNIKDKSWVIICKRCLFWSTASSPNFFQTYWNFGTKSWVIFRSRCSLGEISKKPSWKLENMVSPIYKTISYINIVFSYYLPMTYIFAIFSPWVIYW